MTTNRDLLVAILREPEFLAGGTDTGYLTRHEPAALAAASAKPAAAHALAAALARQARHRAEAPVLGTLPSGWRNVFSAPQRVSYTAAGEPPARLPTGSAGTASTPRSTEISLAGARPRGHPGPG